MNTLHYVAGCVNDLCSQYGFCMPEDDKFYTRVCNAARGRADVCIVDWTDYHAGHRLDSLAGALRHHYVRFGGLIPGLSNFNIFITHSFPTVGIFNILYWLLKKVLCSCIYFVIFFKIYN